MGKDSHHSHSCKDIESGFATGQANGLYPNMMENPQLRWGFIRKVYSILTVQILITVAVASIVNFVPLIRNFFLERTPVSFGITVLILLLPILIIFPMMHFRDKHPVNMILLVVFTIGISMAVGLACITKHGNTILEAAVLTSVVVISLTLYTFWAAKQGYDFNFLGPFLMVAVLVLMFYSLLQIFIPFEGITKSIIGCFAALIFAAFIIYDTDNLIKRHNYDEYVAAAINVYLDIINLFMTLLALLEDG